MAQVNPQPGNFCILKLLKQKITSMRKRLICGMQATMWGCRNCHVGSWICIGSKLSHQQQGCWGLTCQSTDFAGWCWICFDLVHCLVSAFRGWMEACTRSGCGLESQAEHAKLAVSPGDWLTSRPWTWPYLFSVLTSWANSSFKIELHSLAQLSRVFFFSSPKY